jgi:hypothetical protein
MATVVVQTRQLQLTRHGNCILSSHHVNTNVTYVPFPDSLSTKSLHMTHLCTTLMAGTRLSPVATCYTMVLRFSKKLVSLAILASFLFWPHQYAIFLCVTLICHICYLKSVSRTSISVSALCWNLPWYPCVCGCVIRTCEQGHCST